MGFIKKGNAQFYLLFNALLWGSSYVWSKMLLGYLPRFSILSVCSLGSLITTVIMFYPSLKTIKPGAILSSAAISILSILSNTFFMFSLQYTSSSNTAFIVQMSVILTPVIMAVIEKRMPDRKICIGAVTAMAGMFILTCDFSDFSMNPGDLLALGNALFFSLFLTALKFSSKRTDPVHFSIIHHGTNSIAFIAMAVFFEASLVDPGRLGSLTFAALILASIFVASATALVQSSAIKYIRPERATIIYTFEPVAALMLAAVFIGERLDGVKSAAGFVLILASVIISVYSPRVFNNKYLLKNNKIILINDK